MGRFYGVKIKNGDITIESVPKFWRKAVEEWLESDTVKQKGQK